MGRTNRGGRRIVSWADFAAMGGYGVYVWSAYGFAVFVLVVNVIIPLRRRNTVIKIVRQLARAEAGQTG